MKQKLIDQLLHKAGARFGAEGIDYSDFTSSKFAELIVAECIQVLKDTGYPNAHGNCVGVEELKQHFGIK